jgi:hypothetical protein
MLMILIVNGHGDDPEGAAAFREFDQAVREVCHHPFLFVMKVTSSSKS